MPGSLCGLGLRGSAGQAQRARTRHPATALRSTGNTASGRDDSCDTRLASSSWHSAQPGRQPSELLVQMQAQNMEQMLHETGTSTGGDLRGTSRKFKSPNPSTWYYPGQTHLFETSLS